ncbi:hypothetical protein FB451DRAFT_1419750 [Mycena latifolia]|nr:hypothetical protein FB451DRAFT_1419746 [Mycena latifolia]KAJ7433365.1 hypothetical protein FB451DRAFT_1419750 [Mycena latifolia]
MAPTFTHKFKTKAYQGKTSFSTGVYIDRTFREDTNNITIDVINPMNGQLITKIAEAMDVDTAVKAAHRPRIRCSPPTGG